LTSKTVTQTAHQARQHEPGQAVGQHEIQFFPLQQAVESVTPSHGEVMGLSNRLHTTIA
jgi:hypothetical protein